MHVLARKGWAGQGLAGQGGFAPREAEMTGGSWAWEGGCAGVGDLGWNREADVLTRCRGGQCAIPECSTSSPSQEDDLELTSHGNLTSCSSWGPGFWRGPARLAEGGSAVQKRPSPWQPWSGCRQ